jgi:hypothetical protein
MRGEEMGLGPQWRVVEGSTNAYRIVLGAKVRPTHVTVFFNGPNISSRVQVTGPSYTDGLEGDYVQGGTLYDTLQEALKYANFVLARRRDTIDAAIEDLTLMRVRDGNIP